MRMALHVVSRSAEPFDLQVDIDSYIIGRSSSADLVIRDPSVSRQHARIFRDGEDLLVEDLGSHNGTWLNGKPVKVPSPIKVGDEIELARDLEHETSALSVQLRPHEQLMQSGPGMDTQETIIRSVRDLYHSSTSADLTRMSKEDELRDHAERLRLLNEVHNAMCTIKDLDELLNLVLERVFKTLLPEAATIFLEDDVGHLVPAAQRCAEGFDARPVFSETLVRQIAEEGNALLVHDALHDIRFSQARSLHMEGIRSIVASPLLDEEGSLGLIMLYSRDVFAYFTVRDMELLASLASVAALRIRNLQLVAETQSRLQRMVDEQTQELNSRKEELETLDAIVRTINMEHSLVRVLQSVLEQGSVLFPQATKATFLLRDDDLDQFHVAASMGYDDQVRHLVFTEEEAISRWANKAYEIEQGVYLADNVEALPIQREGIGVDAPKSMLVMTMELDGRLEGFVVFDNFSDDSFGRSDLRRLARFRDHAASAVDKARLLHSLERKTDEIGKRQNQLVISEKMASLGHLTAGISHEINNPNNYIYGGAQNIEVFLRDFKAYLFDLAGEEMDEDLNKVFSDWFQKIDGQLEAIMVGSKRITNIVSDLQLVSKLDEANRQHVDLLHSLSATVNLMEPNFQHVDFNCDFRGPLVIHCFPAELNQVFMNIIINACEAMTPEGRVKGKQSLGSLSIRALRRETFAEIRFQDTGPGIDEKHRDRIFEAFYTTKAPGDNSGLGLFTAYKIIEKHEGSIELDTEPGKGTTVTIRIPLDLESF